MIISNLPGSVLSVGKGIRDSALLIESKAESVLCRHLPFYRVRHRLVVPPRLSEN